MSRQRRVTLPKRAQRQREREREREREKERKQVRKKERENHQECVRFQLLADGYRPSLI